MIDKIVVCISVIVILFTAAIGQAESTISYREYVNPRYSYKVLYADGLLMPQGEAANGDGQKFRSSDADVEMAVWGSHNVFDETLKSKFLDASAGKRKAVDRTVTYSRCADKWFVVSGVEGDRVFYEKTYLINDVFLTYFMTYPFSKKKVWDKINATISKSFVSTDAEP